MKCALDHCEDLALPGRVSCKYHWETLQLKCQCAAIMAADSTRHFRGCVLREKYSDHTSKAFTSDQLAALLIGAQMKIPRCEICPRFAVDYGSIAPHKPPEFSRSDTSFRAAYCDQHGEIDPHRFHGMQAIYNGRELAMRLNVTIWGE
jgi:hypothetical protein